MTAARRKASKRAKPRERIRAERDEALRFQAATADILASLSRSRQSAQPVFDAIVENVRRLFDMRYAVVFLLKGGLLDLVAIAGDARFEGPRSEAGRRFRASFPQPVDPDGYTGEALRTRRVMHVAPIIGNRKASPRAVALAKAFGYNSMLIAPLVRNGEVIGAIGATHPEARRYSKKELLALKAFADQAVIAIENTRLFNETNEALERQKASADILRVIARSPGDLQPVLEAMAATAARLCGANDVVIRRLEGDQLAMAAHFGSLPITVDSHPCTRTSVAGRAVLERRTMHVEDIVSPQSRAEYPDAPAVRRPVDFHTILAVPLLGNDAALGVLLLRRLRAELFSDKQVALLESFADQAVIAIDNARLFNETKEALERQTATSEILKVISGSTTDTQPVFEAIVRSAARLFPMSNASMFMRDGELMRLRAVEGATVDDAMRRDLGSVYPIPFNPAVSTSARAMVERRMNICLDTEAPEVAEHIRRAGRAGRFRSNTVVPLVRGDEGIGTIVITHPQPGHRLDEKQLGLLRTFADQAVIAIENVRLFREIQEKSAQLEVANRHKSEFLANMSHELRTPLNAIIGFSEVLIERMFGEVNEKQADYLQDIHESGRHLLSLINDILDLSKIEAGRMELELSSFNLPSVISNALTLVRERAQRHGVQLDAHIDPRLGDWRADERKVKQILVNLLSNAVKFTPEGGRVDVSAKLDTGKVQIAVKDTGVGISADDQAKLFEEFRQVGADAARKAEGTGLGLALTKKFVELHGGAIRVDSAPGKGSTFSFSLPWAAAGSSASSA